MADKQVINDGEVIIPVVKETLKIGSIKTATAQVVIDKTSNTKTVEVPLQTVATSYREERVPIDAIVTEVPEVRHESDRTVIPVWHEEEIVVKRLRLVEEIHLIREETRTEKIEFVSLRSDEVSIQRRKV